MLNIIWELIDGFLWAPPTIFKWVWVNLFLGMLLLAGHLLTLLLLPYVLLEKKRQTTSTVAWFLVIGMLPYLGGLLYLVFGLNRVARRTKSKRIAGAVLATQLPEPAYQQLPLENFSNERVRQLVRLASSLGETVPLAGNSVDILPETPIVFAQIKAAIQDAKHSIHLEYYIWQPDRSGTHLRDLLIKKAEEGVQVRFLYDAVGSMRLTHRFLAPMRAAGIKVASFLPGTSLRERWSINLRSHRKIVVVDGQVGFTGGMNIGDEYLGRNPQFGYWRDTHLALLGPVVTQLQQVFVEDWFFATGEKLIKDEYFPKLSPAGEDRAQVIAGGPDSEMEALHTLMFTALNSAQETITLATSYFVPTQPLMKSLESAAQRGVRVRLLLSGKSAHYATILAARSYYDSLLESGVEIYEYTRGLLHSKTLTIDRMWSFVGTPNFDARSLLLNFEVGVILYDTSSAEQLESQFDSDLKHAKPILQAEWSQRPWYINVPENFCRMFSPVL